MEIRYQVFLSSTYEDLQEERAEVMQALLELDCMPAGMELFPAASEEQWKWIRRVIDESDYYIVVIGGKYGSISPDTNMSYTEMEYDYAIGAGKPTIAFVVDRSVALPENKIEIDPDRRRSLEDFKQKVQKRLCKFWTNVPDLGAKVSRSVTQLIKREPATGWVRADAFERIESEENLRLRNHILELERSLAASRAIDLDNTAQIAHGADAYALRFSIGKNVEAEGPEGQKTTKREPLGRVEVTTTWDAISTAIGPMLLGSARRVDIVHHLIMGYRSSVKELSDDNLMNKYHLDDPSTINIRIGEENVGQIKIQFIALGLIKVEMRQDSRSLFRTSATEYWMPTEEGVRYFVKNLALKRQDALPQSQNLPNTG